MAVICKRLFELLASTPICPSHAYPHAMAVEAHARRALACAAQHLQIPPREAEAVRLAALLHDADDRKLFPASTSDCENARACMGGIAHPELADLVVKLIGWVSTSKNGNRTPDEAVSKPWFLWPRHADRLEAIGWVGVLRCVRLRDDPRPENRNRNLISCFKCMHVTVAGNTTGASVRPCTQTPLPGPSARMIWRQWQRRRVLRPTMATGIPLSPTLSTRSPRRRFRFPVCYIVPF